MNPARVFTGIFCFILTLQDHYVDNTECYTCTNATALCECKTTTQCPDVNDVCYLEYTITGTGKQYNLGCKDGTMCQFPNQTINRPGSIIGRSTSQQCSQCCKTGNCNRQLCQQDPSCSDSAPFDCEIVGSMVNYCLDPHHSKTSCKHFCGLCSLRDGGWSAWDTWSSCDVTCGNGTQTRARTCTNPEPKDCGDKCVGPDHHQQTCAPTPCPVHGAWSAWSPWGGCSATCDVGMERRDRHCSNPYPSRNGDHCFGDSRDDRLCFMAGCHDGGWSDWTPWSVCTRSCDDGVTSRSRTCDSPKPSLTGGYCIGDPVQTVSCNVKKCLDTNVAFLARQTGNLTALITIVFHTIELNQGGGYDSSTGVFTAPIAGTYLFNAQLCPRNGYVHINLMVNGKVFGANYHGTMSKNGACPSMSSVAVLSSGDRVWVRTIYGGGAVNEDTANYWNMFSGVLVQTKYT